MPRFKLKDFLSKTFSDNEINFLDEEKKNYVLNLNEVKNIKNFIKECQQVTPTKKIAGEHRLQDWESGWSGKGVYYSNDKYNNTPYYFKNNTHIRLGDKVYVDKKGFAEFELLQSLQIITFKKYLKYYLFNTICEFGCGTGSNINYLKKHFADLDFYGADWSKNACKKLYENKILEKEKIFRVNYFDRSTFRCPQKKFLAFTNASLEQTGKKYHDFINYLITNKFCIGAIHIEPIRELLDLKSILNKQSFDYSKKRGYLEGFHDFISSFKNISIIIEKDYGMGSKFLNGYQVLCWLKNGY